MIQLCLGRAGDDPLHPIWRMRYGWHYFQGSRFRIRVACIVLLRALLCMVFNIFSIGHTYPRYGGQCLTKACPLEAPISPMSLGLQRRCRMGKGSAVPITNSDNRLCRKRIPGCRYFGQYDQWRL